MVNNMMFNNIYEGKKVLITGNTGFKGCWLTTWLISLGADVYGYSIDIPTEPSMFKVLDLESKIQNKFGDIRSKNDLASFITKIEPDFIFHLAAQAIVSKSYDDPLETISTNVYGTAVLLDILRFIHFKCIVVLITSDKAYDNVEWIWGYRENDNLGGKDIYSGSKGAAELIIKSYWESFLKSKKDIKILIARAGNVVGGGDWSKDRIVVDCINSLRNNLPIELRAPNATRPWQHVLEPLSGYLVLGQLGFENKVKNGEPFNFGPSADQLRTVYDLSFALEVKWNGNAHSSKILNSLNVPFEEANLLKLNCDKALSNLNWKSTMDFDQLVEFIINWYKNNYINSNVNMFELTQNQIFDYHKLAKEKNINWANG
jgi:CDP-glucose 4,6-dehydratase